MRVDNIDEILVLRKEREDLYAMGTSSAKEEIVRKLKIKAIDETIEEMEHYSIMQLKVNYVNPLVTTEAMINRVLLEEEKP